MLISVHLHRDVGQQLLQCCFVAETFDMFCSECHEVDKNCDSLDAAKLTADGCEYTEEKLKLLIEKWSRYNDFVSCLM